MLPSWSQGAMLPSAFARIARACPMYFLTSSQSVQRDRGQETSKHTRIAKPRESGCVKLGECAPHCKVSSA